jgi:large subunit ribosomal protein L23
VKKSVYNVIAGPLITEKATLVTEQGNQVIFRVQPEASKHEIRSAVETLFKVKVTKVHTINYLGKVRRVGRFQGRRPHWKKAYVTLAEGSRIDFFEGA